MIIVEILRIIKRVLNLLRSIVRGSKLNLRILWYISFFVI